MPSQTLGPPFVAVGYTAFRAVSTDGKTWITAPNPTVLPSGWVGPPVYGDNQWLLRGACYGAGRFLTVGGTAGDLGLMLSSVDGRAWSLVGGAQADDACGYGNGGWVTNSRWSADGTTWTQIAYSDRVPARSLVFGNGVFVVVGVQNGGTVAYSRDGKSWTHLPITYAGTDANRKGYNKIAFGGNRYIAINTDVAGSPVFEWDGASDTSFTESPPPAGFSGARLHDIAFGRGSFYVSAMNTLYRRISTGWETIAGQGGGDFDNLVVTDDLFVTEGWWSADGARWTPTVNAPSEAITDIVATPRP